MRIEWQYKIYREVAKAHIDDLLFEIFRNEDTGHFHVEISSDGFHMGQSERFPSLTDAEEWSQQWIKENWHES